MITQAMSQGQVEACVPADTLNIASSPVCMLTAGNSCKSVEVCTTGGTHATAVTQNQFVLSLKTESAEMPQTKRVGD